MDNFYIVERKNGDLNFYEDLEQLLMEFNKIFKDSTGRESSMSLENFEKELVNSLITREMLNILKVSQPNHSDLDALDKKRDELLEEAGQLQQAINLVVKNSIEDDSISDERFEDISFRSTDSFSDQYEHSTTLSEISQDRREFLLGRKHAAIRKSLKVKERKMLNLPAGDKKDKLLAEIQEVEDKMEKEDEIELERRLSLEEAEEAA